MQHTIATRTKINFLYSEWLEIVFGIPQELLSGPLQCNIFYGPFLYHGRYRYSKLDRR